ncbi:MAG: MMPL family transporter [Fibrobacter sp.]|nr:MMPL family transporter [Fibrobacter sp.]
MNTKKSIPEKFSQWYIPLICKHKFKALAFWLVLAVIMAFPILVFPGLKLDADLSHLLPEDTPSVKALEESFERFGSTDRFMIAIQSEDVELVAALQDSISDYIHKNWQGDFVSTQVDNDNQFFKDNALLYLPMKHLERIRDNLEDLQLEIGRKNGPLVVDLLGDETVDGDSSASSNAAAPAEKKERVWFDAAIPQELGLPDEAVSAFDAFFKKDTNEVAKTADEWNPKAYLPAHLKTRLIGTPQPDSTEILFNGVVNAKLIKPSTDYEFVTRILAKTDTLLQYFSSKTYPVPTRFTVEGTYEGLKEVDEVANDSIFSFGISLVLIFFLTVFFFRSLKGPVLVTGSVLYACLPTLAFTALFYGKLNPFTVFVASIILGIGIDYSIHILGNAQKLLGKYASLEEVLQETQRKMIKPFVLASFTTIAAFLTLLVAHFRGFYEFGVVASMGVLFSMLTSVLVLPVFVACMGGIPAAPQKSLLPDSWSEDRIFKFFKHVAIVGFVLGAVALVFAPYVDFEHDLKNLRRPSTAKVSTTKKISTKVTRATNRAVTSTPAAVMGSDPEQLDMLYDTLMVRLHVEKDSTLGSFLTLKSFVPPKDSQEKRLEIIEEIRDLAEARVFDRAEGDDSVNIATLRKLAEVEKSITAEDVPAWTLDLLREKDGSYGKIGFIYGDFPSWDAHALHRFQERYGNWNFKGEKLRTFSSQFILSDVIESVKADSFNLAAVIMLVIVMTLVISFRKPSMFLAGSISFGMGAVLTLGLLGFLTYICNFGKISIYNVIVIPMTLGIGIDATIHFITAWTSNKNLTLRQLFDTTGRNVMASSTTTIAGFVGFLFTTHRGLQGIGHLACIGIGMFLITSVIFSMFLCGAWLKRK